ncbi:MAG: hypothetical protein ACI85O_001752 [Saprospiraceae bacterium]|jgi:hypothetical protein
MDFPFLADFNLQVLSTSALIGSILKVEIGVGHLHPDK